MLAIELVEVSIVRGMVLGAIPPIPITALSDEQFLIRQLARGFFGARRSFVVEIARCLQEVPSFVVFGSADPDVEVGVDPGTGHYGPKLGKILVPGNSFRDGGGFHLRVLRNAVVQAAQEL